MNIQGISDMDNSGLRRRDITDSHHFHKAAFNRSFDFPRWAGSISLLIGQPMDFSVIKIPVLSTPFEEVPRCCPLHMEILSGLRNLKFLRNYQKIETDER